MGIADIEKIAYIDSSHPINPILSFFCLSAIPETIRKCVPYFLQIYKNKVSMIGTISTLELFFIFAKKRKDTQCFGDSVVIILEKQLL